MEGQIPQIKLQKLEGGERHSSEYRGSNWGPNEENGHTTRVL